MAGLMDAVLAVAFAFEAGLKVRGDEAGQAARVSLGLHASRTVDASPFLARDPRLAAHAGAALAAAGRGDLALQVAMWESDAAAKTGVAGARGGALPAYQKAKAWAIGESGDTNLAWIRDIPRAPSEREAIARRLLLLAESGKGPRESFAAAALEAELADLARPSAFGTIFQAATAAGSAQVVTRTLDGLGALDPTAESSEARALLGKLRASLEIQRESAQGRSLDEVVGEQIALTSPSSPPYQLSLCAHLAAAAAREGAPKRAAEMVEKARAAAGAASPRQGGVLVALGFVERSLPGGGEVDPLRRPGEKRPPVSDSVEGACEATRALRSAAPAVSAMRLFDPEEFGAALGDPNAVLLAKELIREGARAGGAAGQVEGLTALFEALRRMGLRPSWDLYLRALIAEGAAQAAARRGRDDAWELALSIAGPALPKFERAKMRGRAACEFVRASETVAGPALWADPYFGGSPPAGRPQGSPEPD